MVGAHAHGLVDRLHRADALIERVDRLVDHRQQDAVDDEGREVLRDGDALAEALHEALGRRESLVLGGDAADQLDQLHHRHRVHEVDADEALRPVRGGGETRDGDGGGVGGEDGALLELGTQLVEDLALDGLVLDGGLDHEVGLGHGIEIGCGANALERGLHLGVGDDAARDLARHVALDHAARLVDRLLLDVVEGYVVAGQRHDMGDAVAHLAGADDSDRLDVQLHAALALAATLQLTTGFLRLDARVHGVLLLATPVENTLGPGYLPAFSSSAFSSGSTWKRSATRPKSATWKIGASPSLLMATMTLLSFMPARCWMAPEMPTAM